MRTVPVALGALLVAVAVAAAGPALTPDQQLVAGIVEARTASRAALRGLARPTPDRRAKASADLLRALAALDKAAKVSPRAVGALETPSVRKGLRDAASLERRARADIGHKRYAAARAKITTALALNTRALTDFGVPLARDFATFAVNQDTSDVPGFADYSALTATVASEVVEIIIGAADRTTANAGEQRGSTTSASARLPITKMSIYTMTEPNGAFAGGWCSLARGLITCPLPQPMRDDQRFTLAFGPKLPRGTEILVKFRTASGKRSYTVLTTRR